VAKCISNVDLEEEALVKAQLILSIREMLEVIQEYNQ